MAAKIHRNDEIIVIAGKDKGNRGKVKQVLKTGKISVEGLNMVKTHQNPNPQAGVQGGIVEQEAAMDVSNVAIFNPTTGKADRVGFKFENEKKVRFFKSNNEII
jgi:large subunit ribosomal protein L24